MYIKNKRDVEEEEEEEKNKTCVSEAIIKIKHFLGQRNREFFT